MGHGGFVAESGLVGDGADLGQLLRGFRAELGLTQKQVADLSSLSVRAIRDLEAGRSRRPHDATIGLLAEALRLSESSRQLLASAAGRVSLVPSVEGTPQPAPVPTTALVGREHEVRALSELLRSGNRLVSVVGLAGVGKTHLAMEVAWRLDSDDHLSVLWVADAETLDDRLAVAGQAHGTLLVLDDYDENRIAGPRLLRLLRDRPDLRILLTGREPDEPPEALTFPLQPLAVPSTDLDGDPARIEAVPSVSLLCRDICRVWPEFELTRANGPALAKICRSLDGIPAALEVCAELCLAHPPQLMAEQLEPAALVAAAEDGWYEDMSRSLARAASTLDEQCRQLLAVLAGVPGRWTLAEAARRSGLGLYEMARQVRALMLLGVVRREEGPDGPCFSVLNLVRRELPLFLPPVVPPAQGDRP
ncbi:helix-turn-helix domain-containing protein [Kutzneria sp. NPDC052558]|uniref:helix-turn-helix domain-containing protein n=1 Tax=Kutzneria sp. NPDC052558 TaxID=3364121 RepID=UPI0037C7A837